MDDNDYFDAQNFVDGFRDRERAGGFRDVLGTEIDMAKKFGKTFERLDKMMKRMEPEDKLITQMENYYFYVDSVYKLPIDSLKTLIDAFRRVPRNIYKNPQMFLLGWLYANYGMNIVRRVIKETNEVEISEIDVIRYYRLYQSVSGSS